MTTRTIRHAKLVNRLLFTFLPITLLSIVTIYHVGLIETKWVVTIWVVAFVFNILGYVEGGVDEILRKMEDRQ